MIDRTWRWLVAAPAYPADDADRRSIDVLGLRLPVRASVVVAVTTFVVLFDLTVTELRARTWFDGRGSGSPAAVGGRLGA